jgi:hypothetical protein
MKQKIISLVIYAITTFALAGFFDGLYGGEPIPHRMWLIWVQIYAASAGTVLFAVACVLSPFSLRFGIACALAACLLSWPFFAGQLSAILSVWRSLFSTVHYPAWGDRLAAVLMLILSSIYSVVQLRGWVIRRL